MRRITSALAVAALLVAMIVGAAAALTSVGIDDADRFVSFSSFDSDGVGFDLAFDNGDLNLDFDDGDDDIDIEIGDDDNNSDRGYDNDGDIDDD